MSEPRNHVRHRGDLIRDELRVETQNTLLVRSRILMGTPLALSQTRPSSEEAEACTMRVRDVVQLGLHLVSMAVGDQSRTSMQSRLRFVTVGSPQCIAAKLYSSCTDEDRPKPLHA